MGEVVFSLERRYHILSRVSAANEGQNMHDIVTRAIKLILYRVSNVITYLSHTCACIRGKNGPPLKMPPLSGPPLKTLLTTVVTYMWHLTDLNTDKCNYKSSF